MERGFLTLTPHILHRLRNLTHRREGISAAAARQGGMLTSRTGLGAEAVSRRQLISGSPAGPPAHLTCVPGALGPGPGLPTAAGPELRCALTVKLSAQNFQDHLPL